jgi:hypothetical protein
MQKEEKIFIVILLALATAMTVMSLQFSFESRLLPFTCAALAAGLLLFLLLMGYQSGLARWYARQERQALTDLAPMTREERRKERTIFAWFLGGVVLVFLVGFLVAIPLFLFLFLRLHARESWAISVVLPLCVGAIVYGGFVYVLRVPLEGGLLFG